MGETESTSVFIYKIVKLKSAYIISLFWVFLRGGQSVFFMFLHDTRSEWNLLHQELRIVHKYSKTKP